MIKKRKRKKEKPPTRKKDVFPHFKNSKIRSISHLFFSHSLSQSTMFLYSKRCLLCKNASHGASQQVRQSVGLLGHSASRGISTSLMSTIPHFKPSFSHISDACNHVAVMRTKQFLQLSQFIFSNHPR